MFTSSPCNGFVVRLPTFQRGYASAEVESRVPCRTARRCGQLLAKLSLHGRRENTLRSHRNVLLRFTDYLFSVGVTDYKLLSADIVNRYVKVVSCNYSNSVVRLHYSILLRFFSTLLIVATRKQICL